jgi:hypothetical protein
VNSEFPPLCLRTGCKGLEQLNLLKIVLKEGTNAIVCFKGHLHLCKVVEMSIVNVFGQSGHTQKPMLIVILIFSL